jgi:protein phosphatase
MKTVPAKQLRLFSASGTDPGLVRNSNEDTVLDYVRAPKLGEPLGLMIVADGMGGHQAGEVASKLAVETIFEVMQSYLKRNDAQDTIPAMRMDDSPFPDGQANYLATRLQSAIQRANLAIHQYANDHPVEAGNLGTTVACVMIKGNHAVIANVGDSRVYLMRKSELSRVTEDHSLVQHLVENGQIKPEEVYDHPHRSIITRALGYSPEVSIDITPLPLASGDRLMVCSDGLWEMIREETEIAQILETASNPAEAVEELINMANGNGGMDNIGIAVCDLLLAP